MKHGISPTTSRKSNRGRWLHVSSKVELVPHPSGAIDPDTGKRVMTVAVVKGKGETYNKRLAYEAKRKGAQMRADIRDGKREPPPALDPGDRTDAFRND
jgi:hypothetical protein